MTARIDDTLEKRFRNRQALREKLKGFLNKNLPVESVYHLNQTISEKFEGSEDALLDMLAVETDDNLASLIILILSNSPQPKTVKAVQKILKSPRLSEKARGRFAALLMLLQGGAPDNDKIPNDQTEQVIKSLESYWDGIDPIEVGHIWLSEYGKVSPDEKIAMLALLFKTGSVSYLPIFSMELGSPDLKIARFVAENLGVLNHESALLMLKSLPEFPNTALRLAIEASIKKLERKKRNGELATLLPTEKMDFYKAYTAFEEDAGHASVIFAKQKPGGGSIHVFFTLIDTLDRGILSSFGLNMETSAEFVDTFHEFSSRHNMISHAESDKSFAIWLLQQAEALSIERGYNLPPEYLLNRRLIWDEKRVSKNYGIKFGLKYCECGQLIRFSKKNRDVLLSNQVALCHECMEKKTKCESCGASINPIKGYAMGRPDLAHVTVICEKCYKSAAAKKKNRKKNKDNSR